VVASAAFRSVEVLGMPEARIPLSQATIYVAQAPKSNQSVVAVDSASKLLSQRSLDPVPSHLRDSHYPGAAELGHGKGYRYSHDDPERAQRFLPEGLANPGFVKPLQPQVAVDREAVLREIMAQTKGEQGDWFEVDVALIAKALGHAPGVIRKQLNALVQEDKLQFKRMFKLGQDEEL